MLGSKSMHEEYYGATTDGEVIIFCDKCEERIETDVPYIERWNGFKICADCIEKLSWERVFELVGRNNIFDILDEIRNLEYA
jgi:hypothetical protein